MADGFAPQKATVSIVAFIQTLSHHQVLSSDGLSAAAELSACVVPPFCVGPFGDTRKVTLTRSRSHEGLGFSVRGGSEHGVGIYVSLVEPGSSAEREGLRVGDQIVAANDILFDNVTHIEAVKVGLHANAGVYEVKLVLYWSPTSCDKYGQCDWLSLSGSSV
uniref:PDZ domain-containing protein n=1 Tax=Neolamprologus brichardi TaxID=32507 RepID=A0A3Q4GVZ2_NEOBR